MRLDMGSLLPRFAIVDTARHNENLRAGELRAGLKQDEIVLFDRAYSDFDHHADLVGRGFQCVGRWERGNVCEIIDTMEARGDILRDELVILNNGLVARRVTAWAGGDGKWREMIFMTNNRRWSAKTVCDLYQVRSQIEVFFKQIKHTLKLADFLGHAANAVRWQVWTALLVYLLLRLLSRTSAWTHGFTRISAIARGALWSRIDLMGFLKSHCGTADGGGETWSGRIRYFSRGVEGSCLKLWDNTAAVNRKMTREEGNRTKKSEPHKLIQSSKALRKVRFSPPRSALWDADESLTELFLVGT